jgi:ribosomal protein L21E
MKKDVRTRGKISLQRYFQPYKEGDIVCLVGEPAVQSGMFHTRYWGMRGVVQGKRGACYEVAVMDRTLRKMFVIHPIHLRKAV